MDNIGNATPPASCTNRELRPYRLHLQDKQLHHRRLAMHARALAASVDQSLSIKVPAHTTEISPKRFDQLADQSLSFNLPLQKVQHELDAVNKQLQEDDLPRNYVADLFIHRNILLECQLALGKASRDIIGHAINS